MFVDHVHEPVGFLPECAKEKSVKTSFTQTENLKSKERVCQVPERQSIEVQTDECKKKEDIFVEFNNDTLASFLNRVTPYVCSVLERNISTRAFVRYPVQLDEDVRTISCLHVLEKPQTENFLCSSVSWNSIGTAIASAYSIKDHESWCEHDASVCIWSLNRKDFDPKKPNITHETDCCVTVVSFHPEFPAVLAAGKFNGEILLWNISKDDDPLLGSTEATLGNHREPITGLHWLLNGGQNNIEFVSCSLDGKILLWKLENYMLVPYKGFVVLTEQLPKYFIKHSKENTEVGITSMSVNTEDRSIFIIGIEGGGIFQCSFDSVLPSSYHGISPVALNNPITMSFERHKGQVSSVQFSPFSRNIFLSSGCDGELRIYSLLQPKPLLTLHIPRGGINSAEWSVVKPLLINCICTNGQLHIWNLAANEKLQRESFPLSSDSVEGISLQQNRQNINLVTTSCSNGKVQVWQLPHNLLKVEVDEKQQLQELSKTTD